MEQEERRQKVQQAIATLSEEHRAIVVLREIDGCCYETIAEMLDLPIGTVRSRLHRARLQLRDVLQEFFDP
jgi:RNA polymerase sigma-70 factor (ECF subfamily)